MLSLAYRLRHLIIFHGEEILLQVAIVILLLFLMVILLVVKEIFGASVAVHAHLHSYLMCALISVLRRIGLSVNAPSPLTTRHLLLLMK